MLLMDEPFGALDPVTRVELQQQFLDLRHKLGKTALLVTHDVREALLLGTRIGVLHNGRLVFLGRRSEFLKAHEEEVRAFHTCLEEKWRGTI
jgi:osmoprotectant transport system ATP-binding protein